MEPNMINELQERLAKLMFLETKQAKTYENAELYRKLINEEMQEFIVEPNGTPEQFKELCDLLWVIVQFANQMGYHLESGMQALVEEYRSKFYTADGRYQPLFREDGKLLKNTGFKKADFARVLGPQ